ncbi:hypothetical protein AOXY_G29517 [Acipenser oxyrinchus oxyrinchus]|uniref:Pyrin domain-containing protein n=1 Tax=Acipenser oxyrinchus oxyrinchus TaxID=40147 RepID=A0AAD8CP72_ACIOX|nr:hypothetical protein AOXY_G29517 [Acipenser oxyrinchus oxyrinchus]
MEKTVKDHIIDTLDDLDEDGLKRFKDELGETTIQGRKIPSRKLKKAGIVEVAGLLISTFTKTHPAEVTISVLNAIMEVDLAEELQGKTSADLPARTPTPPPTRKYATLKELLEEPAGPSRIPIELKVMKIEPPITFTNQKNETKQVAVITFADPTDIIQGRLDDMAKIKELEEEKCILLRGYIIAKDTKHQITTLVLTKRTKFSTTASFDVSSEVLERMQPVPLIKANTRRAKKPITIEGKITSVGKVERVTEKGNKVPIKNITIRDSTAQIKLTLWKDKTRIPIQPGDYIEATNIVLNSYLSNNTTWLSTIQVKEDPEKRKLRSKVTDTASCSNAC